LKKLTLILLSCILLCSTILLAGCKKEDAFIALDRYLDSKVEYQLLNDSETYFVQLDTTLNQEDFSSKQYKYIKFTTKKDYSFGLTLHYITFDIISSQDTEFQFVVDITALKNQKVNPTYGAKTFSKTVLINNLKANEVQHIKIEVEDEFENAIAQIIINNDSIYNFSNNSNLKIGIYNLAICAEHL